MPTDQRANKISEEEIFQIRQGLAKEGKLSDEISDADIVKVAQDVIEKKRQSQTETKFTDSTDESTVVADQSSKSEHAETTPIERMVEGPNLGTLTHEEKLQIFMQLITREKKENKIGVSEVTANDPAGVDRLMTAMDMNDKPE